MQNYKHSFLSQLESESIYILREAKGAFKKPVVLYSIGKDSSVLLHLAKKAFWPHPIPFPFLHIDTGFKFPEMIAFRDITAEKFGIHLIVHRNDEPDAKRLGASEARTPQYVYLKKTKPLLECLQKNGFDAAIGGSRRDEEVSRSKERIFSVRKNHSVWDPKSQRPEFWHTYNIEIAERQTMRVFPLSNWTEFDIWSYIRRENIEVVPLYFAQKRKVVQRNGIFVRVDEFTKPQAGEEVLEMVCRYRTLGCAPSTGVIRSSASTVEEILEELLAAKTSERQNRSIDYAEASAMEFKKREGYF